MRLHGILGGAAIALAGLSGATSISATLQSLQTPAEGRLAAERANRAAPTMRDNLQPGQRIVQSESLKQYFRSRAPAGWRGWKYSGTPTTVAAEKRRATKPRNRLRHKAHSRRKRA